MSTVSLAEVQKYIQANIGPQFHDKKRDKISRLTLDDVIRRKNPYLFRAKGSHSAHDYVQSVLAATVSSGEETTFGNFLEKIAIFVCERAHQGRKSAVRGIDLEFENEKIKYLVSIKSGPNWGNSDQIRKLADNFRTAQKTLATSSGGLGMQIICVEGCCYGKDDAPEKGTHRKLCGQRFWEMISDGNEELYREILEPLGHDAQSRNADIERMCSEKLNVFTAAFVEKFCRKGVIDWDALIRFNSGKKISPESSTTQSKKRKLK